MRRFTVLTALMLLLAGCAAAHTSPGQRANVSAAPLPPGPDRHNVYPPWGVPSDTAARPAGLEEALRHVDLLLAPAYQTTGSDEVPNLEDGHDPLSPAACPDPYLRWSSGGR